MSLRYKRIRKSPSVFLRMFGITVSEFERIVDQFRPIYETHLIKKYRRPGRPFKLDLEDNLLMLFLYYRCYTTQMFVGYLFGIDDSRVCRIIQKLEPLLAQILKISKERVLKQEDLEQLIDATEQPIERPKKEQNAYYSGKKKRHTLKTEIRTTREGRIVHVSKTVPGAVHDFTLHKQEQPPPKRVHLYADSGYQGLDKIHKHVEIPYKKPKNGTLTDEEKEYNHALAKVRVKIENVLAQLKVFRILSDRYRNKRRRYEDKFLIISGIVNLKNGFAAF